ncbi:MAG TPA: ATP-binding protein [Thermoanaerobaculia bacterium]
MSTESLETAGRDRVLCVGVAAGARAGVLAEICDIETVPDLQAAETALRMRAPAAVLAWAEEGGLELLTKMAGAPPGGDIPVLLLGRAESEGRCLEGLAAGAADYLIEPFSPRVLAARVQACLRAAALRREAAGRERDLLAEAQQMRRAEEALRQSEERFRLATEAVSGMIWDWSVGADRVQRSHGLFNLVGYMPGEVESRLGWWQRQIHSEDVEKTRGEVLGALDGDDTSFSVEYRVRHRDGRYVHVWDKGLIVRDAGGRPVRVVGSTIDISDRKRAQAELEAAHREAQAANEAKDQFLATLSHELRTPLTPILAVISRLEEDPRFAGQADELAMVRRNAELEARLIDDLLDLTRISRGKLELHRRRTDARQVVEHALATTEREMAEKGLHLDVNLAAESHRVAADAARLTQVFWNLLSNAVKFTPPGGAVRVRSRLEPGRSGLRELVVEIADTGIGIEPEVLPRIFEAFEQTGRRITRRFGGLGLGLAVSRAIVDLHGGSLTAASAGRDRGSTFTVRLPLVGGQEEMDETGIWFSRSRRDEKEPGAAAPRPVSILLVEDHADTAEAMADLLRLSGHRITIAGSVGEALAAAEAGGNGGGFDLVVSDLGLPDGSGRDLMRELARRHGLKGIALSGYGMEEDVQRSREAGFAHHLTKPVDRQALETTIRQVLGDF